jgi:hypothetical protein
MKKVKVFLASSEELKDERERFEIEIYRKCKRWFDKGIFLHLDIWEDLPSKMSESGRSQNDYNEKVKEADLLVLLAYSKVGMYTAEEFEVAHGQFQETKKPFIYTYFKNADIKTSEITTEFMSLLNFKNKLKELNHFYASYDNFDNLWNQFNKELDELEQNEFQKFVKDTGNSAKNEQINISINNKNNVFNGDYIGRDKVIGR